jgi:hypothetical protein
MTDEEGALKSSTSCTPSSVTDRIDFAAIDGLLCAGLRGSSHRGKAGTAGNGITAGSIGFGIGFTTGGSFSGMRFVGFVLFLANSSRCRLLIFACIKRFCMFVSRRGSVRTMIISLACHASGS